MTCRRLAVGALMLGLSTIGFSGVATGVTSPAGTVCEFSFGMHTSSFTQEIVLGPDGHLWFTSTSGRIGRVTTDGAFTEFTVPTPNSHPFGITVGPDSNLWFTEFGADKIGQITTGGVITEFPVPAGRFPLGITAGPDGALWFTQAAGGIGRMTTNGDYSEHALTVSAGAQPYAITTGSDDNIWFTEVEGNKIGRLTTSGTLTEFALPTGDSDPISIISGPDDNLWFVQYHAGIGRITTDGTITEFPTGIPAPTYPIDLAIGSDENIWFTIGEQIGRITTDGAVTVFPSGRVLSSIALGADDHLWFSVDRIDGIARLGPGPCTEHVTLLGGGAATLTTSNGSFASMKTGAPTYTPPDGVTFPYGVISFEIVGLSPGASTTITLELPGPVDGYWKLLNGWEELTDAVIAGNQITFTITDGGLGDSDGTPDGVIIDPGAPGVVVSPPSGSSPSVTPVLAQPRLTG